MNVSKLSGLFSALKNPTAMASMMSALPSTEGLKEWSPDNIPGMLPVKNPETREDLFVEFLEPGRLFADGSQEIAGSRGDVPDNSFMNLSDFNLGQMVQNGFTIPKSDLSRFQLKMFRNPKYYPRDRYPHMSYYDDTDPDYDDLPF